MAGGYNLGNLAMALRMTGSENPDALIEQLRQQQAVPEQPPPQLPPNTDKALEMTGGRPRESLREREAAIPGNPYPEAVSDRDFNPRASTGTLQRERTEHMNEALDLKGRQGEIASRGMDRQAEAAGELEQGRRDGIAATRQRVEANRAQRQALEAQANERLGKISQMVDNRPEARGQMMQIIGAVLSAAPGGAGGIGRGLAMMGQSMNNRVQEWMQEIGANQALHNQLLAAAREEQGDSEHEVRIESGLQELAAGVYNAELEKIKAETQSEEVKRAASVLQNGLRSQFTDAELQKRTAQQAKRGDDMLWRMPMDQLAEQIAAGNVGKHGQEIYQQRAKASQGVRKGEAELEQTAAQTEKLRREGEGGPKMTESERKVDSVVKGIAGENGPYARLSKIVTDAGGDTSRMDMPRFGVGGVSSVLPNALVPEENLQQDADLNALIGAVLRAESGASITQDEVANKRRGLGLDSSDETVRAQGLQSLLQQVRSIDTHGRLQGSGRGAVRFSPEQPKRAGPGGGGAPVASRPAGGGGPGGGL